MGGKGQSHTQSVQAPSTRTPNSPGRDHIPGLLSADRDTHQPPGSDLALLRLADETLRAAGWGTAVDTGRHAFPVGENNRHVRDRGDGAGQGAARVVVGVGGGEEQPLDEL